jgi:hypothetical protein
MGQLDEWSRRSIARRREGRVEFLGEHGGTGGDDLARALILEFATRPGIQRAYLAHVAFETDAKPAPALCVVSDRPSDDVVRRVGEIFSRLFAKDVFPDILFISQEQEAELKKVCRPFYARPGAGRS